MIESDQEKDLIDVLSDNKIELDARQIDLLERYCQMLWDWNSKVNLTRHTSYQKFVERDLVDSMAFAGFLGQGQSILDVGTGGGVPGVVLAIIRPDLSVELSESVGKRANAVSDIVERLGLPVKVYNQRAEQVLANHKYNTLVIRAVAPLRKLLMWFEPHWGAFDRMLLLKGPAWVNERGEARHHGHLKNLSLRKLKSYPLPGNGVESVLLQVARKN